MHMQLRAGSGHSLPLPSQPSARAGFFLRWRVRPGSTCTILELWIPHPRKTAPDLCQSACL